MANKNDLRYIKTERLIVHTYVDMRMRDPSPVKVSDLCREALINKTTFYSHYDTMESLHRHICRETVADILSRCACAEKAFSDKYKKHVDTKKLRCYTLNIAKALQNKTVAPFLLWRRGK